jgi:hypothetical protein
MSAVLAQRAAIEARDKRLAMARWENREAMERAQRYADLLSSPIRVEDFIYPDYAKQLKDLEGK